MWLCDDLDRVSERLVTFGCNKGPDGDPGTFDYWSTAELCLFEPVRSDARAASTDEMMLEKSTM